MGNKYDKKYEQIQSVLIHMYLQCLGQSFDLDQIQAVIDDSALQGITRSQVTTINNAHTLVMDQIYNDIDVVDLATMNGFYGKLFGKFHNYTGPHFRVMHNDFCIYMEEPATQCINQALTLLSKYAYFGASGPAMGLVACESIIINKNPGKVLFLDDDAVVEYRHLFDGVTNSYNCKRLCEFVNNHIVPIEDCEVWLRKDS